MEIDFIQIVREFGFPTLFAVGLGYCVITAFQWFATKVYQPQQDRFFAFMDRLEKHLDNSSISQAQLVNDLGRLAETVKKLEDRITKWEESKS